MPADDDRSTIDLYEETLQARDWDYARPSGVQLAFPMAGIWATYTVSIYEARDDNVIRVMCGHPLKIRRKHQKNFFKVLNKVNELLWDSHYTWVPDGQNVLWRSKYKSAGDPRIDSATADTYVRHGLQLCERFAPVLLSAAAGEKPKVALSLNIDEPLGRA